MKKITPPLWKDYEIIDSGHGKKLERFGSVTLIRPEIEAKWTPALSSEEWQTICLGEFHEEPGQKGAWSYKQELPQSWPLTYPLGSSHIHFALKFTQFKHLGVFPEQAVNWEFLYQWASVGKTLLNLFAHTGGASQAAALGGAQVTHIDSVYPMVGWAKENGEAAGIESIKWICEDGVTFVEKEIRRGKSYDCVILDPPTFGQSKKGKRWKIENDLEPLLKSVGKLVAPLKGTIILNCYSVRMGEKKLKVLLSKIFTKQDVHMAQLVIPDSHGHEIGCGLLVRVTF